MIVSLVSQKGGVGKSTIAYSVAWELLERGRKVLLLDADPQRSIATAYQHAKIHRLIPPDLLTVANGSQLIQLVGNKGAEYDDIIIDTPGRTDDIQLASMMVSDVVVVPVFGSGFEVWAVEQTVQLVRKAQDTRAEHSQKGQGRPLEASLIITRAKPNTALTKQARLQLQQAPIRCMISQTTNRVEWEEFSGTGMGVAQYAPTSKGAAELRDITDELLVLANIPTEQVPRLYSPKTTRSKSKPVKPRKQKELRHV
jgi:chromosome partitioning protein